MIYIVLFSVLVLFIINVFYRLLINQDEVLQIKDRIKSIEEESKKYKDDRERQKGHFSKIMDENRKLTKLSFKPMIVSFLIIMIMLPVLSIFYSDFSASLGQDSTGNLTIDKNYTVKINENNFDMFLDEEKAASCQLPCLKDIEGRYYKIHKEVSESDGNKEESIRLSRVIVVSPVSLPFIGRELGWIWLYILISIPLSIVIKKLLGVRI